MSSASIVPVEVQSTHQECSTSNTTQHHENDTALTTAAPEIQVQQPYYPRWHSVVAGAASGATSRVATAPLDLLRIRRQLAATGTQQQNESIWASLTRIAKSEGGAVSLFRGNVAATYLWIGYSAVQFSLYTQSSEFLRMYAATDSSSHSHTGLEELFQTIGSSPRAVSFVSGATAGFCATLATYPFDLCRTTFAAQGLQSTKMMTASSFHPPKSMADFSMTLYKQQGIKGFFAGSAPAVIQIIPYMGINFCVHDELMQWSERSGFGMSGMAGVVSGGLSKLLVYPLDTVKKRLQAQAVALNSGTNYKGTFDCLVTMSQQEGVKSLYNGLAPSVLKNMVGTGLAFACFTFTKDVLETIHDHKRR